MSVNSKSKDGFVHLSKEELSKLDKEQLITKVISMQQHIKQLQSLLTKQQQTESKCLNSKKENRIFDFSRYKLRHIFLKFLYLGWNYDGFVIQEDTLKTVEASLFDALLKTKLIRSRETSNYHRCGRTDKGVSAYTQVVSLTVRSQLKNGIGIIEQEDYSGHDKVENSEELDYISALNAVLPKDIRVICWSSVEDQTKSARFDCQIRRYHYYFPMGQLDLAAMNKACHYLLGTNDYRNLCKMDVANGVLNYVRRVESASVQPIHQLQDVINPYNMCVFQIESTAFIWHQIRCIMSILFLVGQRLEEPTIVQKLLNIEQFPSKPQYGLAPDLPLVLYDAKYESCLIPEWNYGKSSNSLKILIGHLHQHWIEHSVKTTITKSMINSLLEIYEEKFQQTDSLEIINQSIFTYLSGGRLSKIYKPLLDRPLCDSLQSKIDKQQSKPKRIKLT
ncbi:hypothetical protein RDWZM_002947 [Blomia tropicalis]|uniref:Pseudouridine synthase I TruA alpha/beta domain-containing protein n=1 Tax=Blomia tropicalis TaxID=40697 RepID=A0A9Q0MH82_BLOTA|nr:hypothetical protein RDWZM_002947 [Blomia tropicalis]